MIEAKHDEAAIRDMASRLLAQRDSGDVRPAVGRAVAPPLRSGVNAKSSPTTPWWPRPAN